MQSLQFTTWMQNTTMSYGHSYSNYTEDARKLLTGASKFISLTPIPRKFIPESLFQWNVSLGTEGLSPTLGNKDGYGGKGAQGFSSSQVIKMQIGGGGGERPAGRFPRPACGHSTHIRPLSAPPCAPGLPPYPVRPLTWGGKESQKLSDKDSWQQCGEAFGVVTQKAAF